MAYGEKYYIPYCNSFGDVCRLSILFEDFEGTALEVTGQEIPFRKKYEGDWIYDPISPSTGNVNMVFGTGDGIDFEEFWESDEKTIKVEHYVNSALDWVGFVIPDGFSYEFTGGLYYAEILAADGLSTLENLLFQHPDGEPYGPQDLVYNNDFEFPFSLIATEILKKLDLGLNTYMAVDVYERSMTQGTDSRDSDSLSQSYANVKTYINDSDRKDIAYWQDPNTPMNCKVVMENLCHMFGAKVYQNKGRWQIKRVNLDINRTDKYFFIYNTASVYIGREAVVDEITIPCTSITNAMIGDDHLMSMREVYKAFRMNYKYTFKRDGDNPVNLLQNGDFSVFNNTSKLAAPEHWTRYHDPTRWDWAMMPVSIGETEAGGFTTGIRLGQQAPGMPTDKLDISAKPWRSLMQGPLQVTKGDKLSFKLWQRIRGATVEGGVVRRSYSMVYRVSLMPDQRFGKESGSRNGGVQPLYYLMDERKRGDLDQMQWMAREDAKGNFGNMFSVGGQALNTTDANGLLWRNYELVVPEVPESGYLFFEVIGMYSASGRSGDNNPSIQVIGADGEWFKMYNVRDGDWDELTNLPFPQITGIELGFIPDPQDLPEKNYYIYENENVFSYQRTPIEVLNGDTLDEKHISGIIVPSNVTGQKNFWTTQDEDYELSSLGLITVKSIMQLFHKPFRMLEGMVKAQGASIDSRFTFEALPGKKFMLKAATFNEMKNYIEGAEFFEIASEDDILPPGGIEGGNTLDPVWVPTGNERCTKSSGLNTGTVEVQERNINEASESFNQTRWVEGGEDLAMCPIGEPSPYYWGCDDSTMEIGNLTDFTYTIEDDIVQCPFNNSGELYIYFVHLSSLGVVENVFIDAQDRIISDFAYLTDIVLGGYPYKVLRQNYVTSEFENLDINFDFN